MGIKCGNIRNVNIEYLKGLKQIFFEFLNKICLEDANKYKLSILICL